MAAAQLTSANVSSRGLSCFEGLRSSSIKIAAFVSLNKGLNGRSFSPLVVKAANVVAPSPKYTSIKPLADRIVVKIKEAEDMTSGGILLPTTAVRQSQTGEVVAVGEGQTIGGNKIDFSVETGAQVLYSKYAGTELEFNGSNHLILNESNIIGILESDDIKDLKPLNEAVLIKIAEAEDKTAGGLLLSDTSIDKPSVGTVIAVGPGYLDGEGKRSPLSLSEGNTVIFTKYSGNEFRGKDGSNYLALRASDVMAVLL